MAIKDVVQNVQGKWRTLAGILSAPDTPPENANVFPFAVTYERAGRIQPQSYGWSQDFITVFSELHVSQTMFQEAIVIAQSYKDDFTKLFISDPSLGKTVSTVREIRYTFGRLEWNGIQTIGYRFEIDAKVNLQI